MNRVLLVTVLVAVVFYVFALVDLALIDRSRIRGIPKPAWIAVVVFLPIVGAVLWFAVGRIRMSELGGTGGSVRRGPVAPDDDPAFLNRLGREKDVEDRIEKLEQELRDLDDDDPAR